MESYSHKVSLKKPVQPEPWTDPETGEIYPGGKPADPAEIYTQPQPPAPVQQEVYPAGQPKPSQPAAPVAAEGRCFCRNCGASLEQSARFCPVCGYSRFGDRPAQPAQPQQIINNYYNTQNNIVQYPQGKPKNKWVAFLLCFFLGTLGVHRFYEGKIATGILWLLTAGLLGIGWLVDVICILCKPTTYYVK